MQKAKTGGQKIKGGLVEKPKKLPAAFPEKFNTAQGKSSAKAKRGKGARFHGSM